MLIIAQLKKIDFLNEEKKTCYMIFWIFLLHLLLEFYSKKKLWLIKYCDYLFPIKHGFIEKQNQKEI